MSSLKTIFYRPYEFLLVPVCNSTLELLHLIGDNFRSIAKFATVFLLTFALASLFGYYTLAIRSLIWIALGIASSIGFGFGMHTFVLFLAPHIAAVTMAAHSCRSLDFIEPPYPAEIVCPEHADLEEVTFIRILRKVALESFMWGLGTAIGELPPYLAARLRAQAINRKTAGDDPNSDKEEAAGWEIWMIKVINKVGFMGILLCAAIPNPLFDAAGVASGMAQIPFLSFFGATMIGKAVIKVLIQTSFVILSFHKNNLETFIMQLNKKLNQLFPSMKDLNLDNSLTVFLREQRNNVLKKRLGESKQTSLLGNLFNWIIFACFALFIASLINALDKQYRTRKNKNPRMTE